MSMHRLSSILPNDDKVDIHRQLNPACLSGSVGVLGGATRPSLTSFCEVDWQFEFLAFHGLEN
jgi:hypothetical protein